MPGPVCPGFFRAGWYGRTGSKDRALLEDTLYVGLEEGVNALYGLADPREDLLMLPRDIVTYIQGLRYYIGHAEQQSIEQFATI